MPCLMGPKIFNLKSFGAQFLTLPERVSMGYTYFHLREEQPFHLLFLMPGNLFPYCLFHAVNSFRTPQQK